MKSAEFEIYPWMIAALGFAVTSDRVRGSVDVTEYVGVDASIDIWETTSVNDPVSIFGWFTQD